MIIAASTPEALIGLLTLLLGGGFVTALISAFKARPERDAVVISNVKNVQEMLRGTSEAVFQDWQREHTRRVELEGQVEKLEKQVEKLETQLEARSGKVT